MLSVMFRRVFWLVPGLLTAMIAPACLAQSPSSTIEPAGPARPANSDGVYQALRGALPVGDGVNVKDLTLDRQGGTFHFEQGTFYFYGPVNGLVTGAVFSGKGHFELAPKDKNERRVLAQLTKSEAMSQDFATAVFRFTDGSAEEIRKASTGPEPASGVVHAAQAASELAKSFRTRLHENLDLRIMRDVTGGSHGQFFLASFHMGGSLTGRNVLFIVDPAGTPHAAPDQVELATWDAYEVQTWAAYRMEGAGEGKGVTVHVTNEKLDVTFERSGAMHASAETTLTVARDGLRLVRLNLYPTLRVSGVYSDTGLPLDFIQENKDADPDFAVVLPQAAKAGDTIRLLTRYGGSDALTRTGEGMYYLRPGAREKWYPAGQEDLGGFAGFRMTFHVPKGLQIIATGKQISSDSEPGGQRIVWATDTPIPVAGFNLGSFKSNEDKTPQGFVIDAYANTALPDYLQSYANSTLGVNSTNDALKYQVSQGKAAIQIYSEFFGKLPYDHVALTEQSACTFGQSWPMLVYLPVCAFWDTTIQHQMGLLDHDPSYWKEVTPHEVSHQWWGQMVGFNSYRDQWMSEGFANFSVGLFLLNTQPKMDQYRDFWAEQKKNLLEKNAQGKRPVDVGSLTMGYRVSNEKTGEDVYQMLIYSKGAYVMHMLEMMYWTPTYKHEPFQKSLQKFIADYNGKAATTEDFKASIEKTMPKWLDINGDGKLDWFFDEYVYGTELPHYTVTSDATNGQDGTSIHFKVSQSNVSDKFMVLLPVYLQMENGNTVRIANLTMRGNTTLDHVIKVGKLPSPYKKVLVNYNGDILSD